MIKKMSHTTIYVRNQDEAKAFYTEKLGFEVRTDAKMGDFRWLTVGPKGQPDLEIVLYEPKPSPMMDEEAAAAIRLLLDKGVLGAGVFETDDVHGDYERLSQQGVQFMSPPQEKFYGIETLMRDNSGNWFSVTQHKGK